MASYYVNKNQQPNGDHEVHKQGCVHMPAPENRIYVGEHVCCQPAVQQARLHYARANGCYYCSYACHTS